MDTVLIGVAVLFVLGWGAHWFWQEGYDLMRDEWTRRTVVPNSAICACICAELGENGPARNTTDVFKRTQKRLGYSGHEDEIIDSLARLVIAGWVARGPSGGPAALVYELVPSRMQADVARWRMPVAFAEDCQRVDYTPKPHLVGAA